MEWPFGATGTKKRTSRLHWNAATEYPHFEAHLLDLLEALTPLPTDLCRVVLGYLCGDALVKRLKHCLPLPRGYVHLSTVPGRPKQYELRWFPAQSDFEESLDMQTQESDPTASENRFGKFQIPFRGGGSLVLAGSLFSQKERNKQRLAHRQAFKSKPATCTQSKLPPRWHALSDVFVDHPSFHLQSWTITQPSNALIGDRDDNRRPRNCNANLPPIDLTRMLPNARHLKKRRTTQGGSQSHGLELLHKARFAYFQVLPFGVNLFAHPESRALGLVSGVCLLFGRTDSGSDSVIMNQHPAESTHSNSTASSSFTMLDAQRAPLSLTNVSAFFRPNGECEFEHAPCRRKVDRDCATSSCGPQHCSLSKRWAICQYHILATLTT